MQTNAYIKRSDAVSAFCRNCEGTEVCGQLGEPCEEVKRIKAIPAADVEPKQRWIPVTERFPEEWRIVMTYQPTPSWMEDGIGLRRTAVYIGNGKWREAEKHNMMELPVTHWMPLPEPPKEASDAEHI